MGEWKYVRAASNNRSCTKQWQLDENGVKRVFAGRNREQRDVLHQDDLDMAVLAANGLSAVPLNAEQFEQWINTKPYTFVNFVSGNDVCHLVMMLRQGQFSLTTGLFVNFVVGRSYNFTQYAPWCVWCQKLEPVWEALGEHIEREGIGATVVKIDCVANRQLCTDQKIQAFPTLRLFKENKPQLPDYKLDRTVDALTSFVKSRLEQDENLNKLSEERKHVIQERAATNTKDHPGCMVKHC